MILYYDVIDPAAVLTPLSGAEPTTGQSERYS